MVVTRVGSSEPFAPEKYFLYKYEMSSMDQIRQRTALVLLALGFLGWLAILYAGGPLESEPVGLLGPIAFDPMWALVAGTGVALACGAVGLLKPRLVD